jgi:glycosyltransferase involved in cell wall biosynthesis
MAALVITGFAKWHGVPYILELRDVYPQVYAEAGLLKRNSFLYRTFAALSVRMYRGAKKVIAATQGLEREVRDQAPDAQVRCVYNGFPSALTQRQGVKHTRFTVCFHGVLGFFQDVETLIEVARRLQDFDIDVLTIGYGRKEQLLQQCHLPNLRFLGRLSFDDTMAQVEHCHVGLCLRLDDGISKDAFPVKVWEYMGLGLPCVVTPQCEAGDFLQQHACGLQFNAGDVQGIVQAVVKLRDDPAQMANMAQRCRATGSAFTREKTGMAVAELIQATAREIRPI